MRKEKVKTPEKFSPEWHQLQIAKKTLQMNPAIITLMGGMTLVEAQNIVNKYK